MEDDFLRLCKALEKLNQLYLDLILKFFDLKRTRVEAKDCSVPRWSYENKTFYVEVDTNRGPKVIYFHPQRPNLTQLYNYLPELVDTFRKLIRNRREELDSLSKQFEEIDKLLAPHYLTRRLKE